MNIYFMLSEMTFLRYYMPLIIEAKRQGHECRVIIGQNNKYTNPAILSYRLVMKKYAEQHGFECIDMNSDIGEKGVCFVVEGVHAGHPAVKSRANKIVSLTYMRDFSVSYKTYIDSVDHVVMPSKYMAEHYGCISGKNLYLGCPKYDISFDENEIVKKYNLDNKANALVIFPNLEYMQKVRLPKIYGVLKDLGYQVVVKSRGKHHAPVHLRGDLYFEDDSWYPHTSMELIYVSKICINFGSTAVKECVMLCRPWINFQTKPGRPMMHFLYNPAFSRELRCDVDFNECRKAILEMTEKKQGEMFKKVRKQYLFDSGNVSSNILKAVC